MIASGSRRAAPARRRRSTSRGAPSLAPARVLVDRGPQLARTARCSRAAAARRVSSAGASSLCSSRVDRRAARCPGAVRGRRVARRGPASRESATSSSTRAGRGQRGSRTSPARIGLRSLGEPLGERGHDDDLAADALGLVEQHPVGLDAGPVVVPQPVQRLARGGQRRRRRAARRCVPRGSRAAAASSR